jgi:hypothetical protein
LFAARNAFTLTLAASAVRAASATNNRLATRLGSYPRSSSDPTGPPSRWKRVDTCWSNRPSRSTANGGNPARSASADSAASTRTISRRSVCESTGCGGTSTAQPGSRVVVRHTRRKRSVELNGMASMSDETANGAGASPDGGAVLFTSP